jgi:hypothetical protein
MEKKNVGKCDRMIRVVVGIAVAGIAYYKLEGMWQTVAYVVATIAVLTGIVRYCPLYSVFGCDSTKCCCKMCGSCKSESKDVPTSVEAEKTQE